MKRQAHEHGGVKMAAAISDCDRYRYWLRREWDPDAPCLFWVMLNPSTADGFTDDPTTRRCVDFAKRWGFGSIEIRNLFAFRTPSPEVLIAAALSRVDIVGPDCNLSLRILEDTVQPARDGKSPDRVIAAWGNRGDLRNRAADVRADQLAKVPLYCLDVTATNEPSHPLYLRSDIKPKPFNDAAFRRPRWRVLTLAE